MSPYPRAELVAILRRRCALLPAAERERYLQELPRCLTLGPAALAEGLRAAQTVRGEWEQP